MGGLSNQAPHERKANYKDYKGSGNMQHDKTPGRYSGPMRRNCDMCVRRKVRCCGTKPRCSICIRKGDVCVYSLKRRPGPRVRLSSCFGSGSRESSNDNPMTGTDRYNTRRMSADGFPDYRVPLTCSLSAPTTSNYSLLDEHDINRSQSLPTEEDPTVPPIHPQDAKRPCKTLSIKDTRKVDNDSSHTHSNNSTPDKKIPVNKLQREENKSFNLPSSMRIPDSMVDLMDDGEHLLPFEFIKLENISTRSADSDTSIESGEPLTGDNYIGEESMDFLDIFSQSNKANDKPSSAQPSSEIRNHN